MIGDFKMIGICFPILKGFVFSPEVMTFAITYPKIGACMLI